MTQSDIDTEPVTPAHETPVFISESLSPVCGTESVKSTTCNSTYQHQCTGYIHEVAVLTPGVSKILEPSPLPTASCRAARSSSLPEAEKSDIILSVTQQLYIGGGERGVPQAISITLIASITVELSMLHN